MLSRDLQANVLSVSLWSNQPITQNYIYSEHTVILVFLGRKEKTVVCLFVSVHYLYINLMSLDTSDYSAKSTFEASAT